MKNKYNKHYSQPRKVPGENSIPVSITGRNDAVFIRNKYQAELDNANLSIVKMVHYIEADYKTLKLAYDSSQRLKKNIESHLEERKGLEETLKTLLSQEHGHEKEMWYKTIEGRVQESSHKNVAVYQRNKDSDIEAINVGTIGGYPTAYPDVKTENKFKTLVLQLEIKDKEILQEKNNRSREIASYNHFLSLFEEKIVKADEKFAAYDKILNEGTQKLQDCRYHGGILYKLSSEKARSEINLDTLSHRISQFRKMLDLIKQNVSQYQNEKFVKMGYD